MVDLYLLGGAAKLALIRKKSLFKLRSGSVENRAARRLTVFPREIFHAPRSWAEQNCPKLIYWNEAERGGHFAAFEQPAIFTREIRAAFRSLRSPTDQLPAACALMSCTDGVSTVTGRPLRSC
jgi:hypothetical protein